MSGVWCYSGVIPQSHVDNCESDTRAFVEL
jgi:hypothetical protein